MRKIIFFIFLVLTFLCSLLAYASELDFIQSQTFYCKRLYI
jgi:hypothetical protein